MKLKLTLIAAFVAVLGLTACGGGGSGSGSTGAVVSSPATLTVTDTVVGTGAVAANNTIPTIKYTGWLYSATAAGFKGSQFDTGTINAIGTPTSQQIRLGLNSLIAGFEQGVLGMKVGGKRTLLIPSSLGYGPTGKDPIPPNSGLVFEVELTAVN